MIDKRKMCLYVNLIYLKNLLKANGDLLFADLVGQDDGVGDRSH